MAKHECLVSSETATADEMATCFLERPHMKKYCGTWVLEYKNSRLFVDISKADLDHPERKG